MLFTELHDVVDQIAGDLGVAAVLENSRLEVIAYSPVPEHGLIDRLRRDSIIRRRAPADVAGWLRECGAFQAEAPLWIPPRPEYGALGRLCCPIRHRGQLLGFLWLIDDQRAIYDARGGQLAAQCEHLALLLYERYLFHRLHGEAVAHLLSEVPALRAAAAATIMEHEMWPRGARVCAVVVTVAGVEASRHAHRVAERAIVTALERTGGDSAGAAALRATFAEHAVLLEPDWSEDDRPVRTATAVAHTLSGLLREHDEVEGLRAVVGIGDPQTDLCDAQVSRHQARSAAKVASLVPSVGPVALWRDLGAYRTLVRLPLSDAPDADLDPRVVTLFRDADMDLLATLETYLDLGGDVHRTAEQLHTHRGTVYNRLDKIERLTDLRLHDGNDRLCAHLGFKIARLTRSYPL